MHECLFCKIAKKEIPSKIIYEDPDVTAFLDIAPVHPGHVLVIPKTHSADFSELDPVDREAVLHACQKITKTLLELGADGCNVSTNVKRAAGQVIFHTHFHIIPRYANDGLPPWPEQNYKDGEADEWSARLRELLSR